MGRCRCGAQKDLESMQERRQAHKRFEGGGQGRFLTFVTITQMFWVAHTDTVADRVSAHRSLLSPSAL